jgi:hypothetical protein
MKVVSTMPFLEEGNCTAKRFPMRFIAKFVKK